MTEIFDLLDRIESRPGLYVGGGDERGVQLRNLELLLHGYDLALRAHRIDEPGNGFLIALGKYLAAKHAWSMSRGAIAAIRDRAENDDDAWNMFWSLVREYKSSLGEK